MKGKNNSVFNGAKLKDSFKTKAFRAGGYSVAAAVIVILLAVVLNILVDALPSKLTKLDTSSNQLFSISQQTEEVTANLKDDVNIYWIVQANKADDTLGLLLDRYASLSDKITVQKKDPDVYPAFLKNYNITSVTNNSLLVESGGKYRYVDQSDIYEYDYSSYYTDGTYDVSFNGESAVTSAINYVVSEDLPKLYTLTGHGEAELSQSFAKAVTDGNIETASLSLLTVDAVPSDANALLIYSPQSDISADEQAKLKSYMQSGGNLILLTDPPKDGTLTRLESLMADYGVTTTDGIVVEGSQNNYAWGTPYYLLPELGSHEIVSPLKDGGYKVLLPVAQGLTVSDTLPEGVTVSKLLTTSSSAFSKVAGYDLTTYEKEEDDIDGPFVLAVAITDTIDDSTKSQIVWISSGALLDDQTNAQVSGANQDFFINSISWMCEREENISIHAKALSSEYLTMSSGTGALLAVTIIGIIPLGCLAIGISIWARRKRR